VVGGADELLAGVGGTGGMWLVRTGLLRAGDVLEVRQGDCHGRDRTLLELFVGGLEELQSRV
jgi:hypothetical protein